MKRQGKGFEKLTASEKYKLKEKRKEGRTKEGAALPVYSAPDVKSPLPSALGPQGGRDPEQREEGAPSSCTLRWSLSHIP